MDRKEEDLENNLPMVNYIMLHRIYDILTLMVNMSANNEEDRQKIAKMVEYHSEGFLLGPSPAFRAEDNNNE